MTIAIVILSIALGLTLGAIGILKERERRERNKPKQTGYLYPADPDRIFND